MRFLAGIPLALFFFACADPPTLREVPKLNGYWEIAKVTFPNGQEKEYHVSTTVDYIEISGNKGFKKKVQPKLNGTYSTSDDAEFFTIDQQEASLFLRYKNDLSQWEEQLLKISDDAFTVINQERISYTYRRYTAINVRPQ